MTSSSAIVPRNTSTAVGQMVTSSSTEISVMSVAANQLVKLKENFTDGVVAVRDTLVQADHLSTGLMRGSFSLLTLSGASLVTLGQGAVTRWTGFGAVAGIIAGLTLKVWQQAEHIHALEAEREEQQPTAAITAQSMPSAAAAAASSSTSAAAASSSASSAGDPEVRSQSSRNQTRRQTTTNSLHSRAFR